MLTLHRLTTSTARGRRPTRPWCSARSAQSRWDWSRYTSSPRGRGAAGGGVSGAWGLRL